MPGSSARRRSGKPLLDDSLVNFLQPDEENLRAAAEATSSYFEGRLPLGFLGSVPIDKIRPRRDQPRIHFDEQELRELADTFRGGRGVLQPLLCRPVAEEEVYEIVAGERRWRAAQMVGFTTVPVIAKERSDREAQIDALLENVARQNLAPMEEAKALGKLVEQSESASDCARSLGWTRQRLANKIRLLKLAPQIVAEVQKKPHNYSWFQLIEILKKQDSDGVEPALALLQGQGVEQEKPSKAKSSSGSEKDGRRQGQFIWQPRPTRSGGFQLKVVAKTRAELPQAISSLKDLLTRLEGQLTSGATLDLGKCDSAD